MFARLKWLLPVLALLIAILMLSSSLRQEPQGGNLAKNLVLEVTGPIESFLTSIGRSVSGFFQSYVFLVRLEEENKNLRNVIARQEKQIAQLNEYKVAALRLTALLGMRQAHPLLTMKVATIIAWDPSPWNRQITIDLGSDDGVASGQAVLHDTGVVGRVVETSANYARVLLITDFDNSVDSFLQRTRNVGILAGQGAKPLALQYVPKDADVRPGDVVITSGLDGFFPRGLTLGVVSRVNRQSPELFMGIDVRSAVTFDSLEEVMVVVNQIPPIDWLSLAPREEIILENLKALEAEAEALKAGDLKTP